jgi:O-acetyl-ADP-ribose deacetylase (regulator of RNase III)
MKMYRNQFFKTEDEAFAFQDAHGGAVYSNAKYSHTKQSYMVEAKQIACLSDEFIAEHPYCVAWNQNIYFEHVIGDLLKAEADVIVHQVNCQGVMGAGVAKQIREQFPTTYIKYKDFCYPYKNNTSALLGKCLYVQEEPFVICNAFGQDFYYRNTVQTQYDKLAECFRDIAEKDHGKRVALPWKIGCGLAGGDWDIVQKMIYDILAVEGECKVTLYEFV